MGGHGGREILEHVQYRLLTNLMVFPVQVSKKKAVAKSDKDVARQ